MEQFKLSCADSRQQTPRGTPAALRGISGGGGTRSSSLEPFPAAFRVPRKRTGPRRDGAREPGAAQGLTTKLWDCDGDASVSLSLCCGSETSDESFEEHLVTGITYRDCLSDVSAFRL